MPSLYEQLNPSAAPAAAGTPGYQANIVQGAANQLKPQYNIAIKNARQSMANRGMLRGGLEQSAEGQINQDYRGQIANVANQAATHSADLGEQERVRQEQRGWQVQDIQRALQQRQNELADEKAAQEQAMWADLIGTGVGTVGTVYGGYLGGKLAKEGTTAALNSQKKVPAHNPNGPY